MVLCLCVYYQGLHPRRITGGLKAAEEKALQFLEQVQGSEEMDRETLADVARTPVHTKIHAEVDDVLTEAIVDPFQTIKK